MGLRYGGPCFFGWLGIQDAAAIQRVEDADVFSGVRKLLDQGCASEMGHLAQWKLRVLLPIETFLPAHWNKME